MTTRAPVAKGQAPQKRKLPGDTKEQGGRVAKRAKTRDARSILTQTQDAALLNGELNLQTFLKTRELEIKALEDGMRRSKSSLMTRAFQQVPRDMRRRTASHNVKRVPKRLHKRAKREMQEDKTPTVDPSKRRPRSTRARLRIETAKRLGILAAKKKRAASTNTDGKAALDAIEARQAKPKLRRNTLSTPPKAKSKFRKRQIHKTWLPTHMWHAKRAKMTEPGNPMWRFALPITPTAKSYRPTHRAGGARGALMWDMSYMSTIGLYGTKACLCQVLEQIGITEQISKSQRWINGQRIWNGWLSRRQDGNLVSVGPATIIWASPSPTIAEAHDDNSRKPRKIIIRVHPACFLELWTEILRISRLQRPQVHVEDLRFEIGSLKITGPAATEALLGVLHPYDPMDAHAQTFRSLTGVTNAASLPSDALLAFSILDPRLRYPPRPRHVSADNTLHDDDFELLEMLSSWPLDASPPSCNLFERDARYQATRLPSQKALNRRKGLAPPGEYAKLTPSDHPIPILLHTSGSVGGTSSQGSWTLLAPWKCILPIWYCLTHHPLSSGGNPRFGGLDELRQMHFEHGIPWFPADFPAVQAGHIWECDERLKRKKEWERRPRGKRIEWSTLDLGAGRKGEHGIPWACDFESITQATQSDSAEVPPRPVDSSATDTEMATSATIETILTPLTYIHPTLFKKLMSTPASDLPAPQALTTVRLDMLGRGVATPCARIYRLPSITSATTLASTLPSNLRQRWLALVPTGTKHKPLPKRRSVPEQQLRRLPLDAPLPQRVRLLAQSLLQDPPLAYPGDAERADVHPWCPDMHDLIGFVTTGSFNLAEGKGGALASISARRALEDIRGNGRKEGMLCIVRNVGEKVGRLARWELV